MFSEEAGIRSKDFTLQKYSALLEAILDSGYGILTFESYFTHPNTHRPFIIIRHDVDKWPGNALVLAQLEHEKGIQATYYFRTVNHVFNPDIIQKISALGHEIGYHYETMAEARGDKARAYSLFCHNLERLRQYAEVKTACMHGSSFSKYDNRSLWKNYDLHHSGILGEPYLDVDYSEVIYFSDSGGSWKNSGQRFRDIIERGEQLTIAHTDDLIHLIRSNAFRQAILLMHPDRWNPKGLIWHYENITKKLRNFLKRIYRNKAKMLWVAYLLVILLLVLMPLNGAEHVLRHRFFWRFRVDQLFHIVLFFPWVACCVGAMGKRQTFPAIVTGLLAAFFFEGIQILLPYRSFNPVDMIANGAGVLLGAIVPAWKRIFPNKRAP